MKNSKRVMLAVTVFCTPKVFAAADVYTPTKTPSTAVDETTGTKRPTTNINQNANTGQATQSAASGANQAIGQALMATGAAMMSNPHTRAAGAALMAMGVLAMMQSAHDAGAAAASYDTGLASEYNPASTETNTATDSTGTSGFATGKIAEGKAALKEAGYSMDSKGNLTHPDGSTTPASAFNSGASMAAAGIDPAAISEANKILNDTSGKVSGVAVNSGGSGGSISEGESSGESASATENKNPFDLNAQNKASLVAGKTVMFDGEPIGVRGQNIFDMVHTCYQKKRAGKHFIESETDVAASARMPASVGSAIAPASVKSPNGKVLAKPAVAKPRAK